MRLLFVLILLSLSTSACIPVMVGAAAGSAASAGSGLYLTQRHGADRAMIEEILMAFENNERLRNLKLDVDVQGGVVKLYGFVPVRQAEEDAMAVAGSVDGVKEVISRITILPPRLL